MPFITGTLPSPAMNEIFSIFYLKLENLRVRPWPPLFYCRLLLAGKPSFPWKRSYLYKSQSITLRPFNQANNILVVLQSFPIKIWGKSVKGFLSYDRTYKHHKQRFLPNYILAWEPSAAKVTKSYSLRLPALFSI